MARQDRESPIQVRIVDYLRSVLPPQCVVHHCKNEINKRGANIAREIAKAKRKGMVTGFPDLMVLPFAHAFPAMFFEVKAEGKYATKEQKECHEQLRALGYRVAVVRSVDDVREALREWSIPTKEVMA